MKHIFFILFISICFSVSSQNEVENGPYKEYFDNGQIKTSGQYENKKKVGSWKEFYETGELKRTYSYTEGKYDLERKSYFKNGNTETERILVDGNKLFKRYFESGELLYERQLGGGYTKIYFRNGNLKSIGNYSDCELTGKWKSFYETGELEWEVEYFNSYREGIYKQYYKTGQIKVEGQNKKGQKHGLEKRYYSNGALKWEGKYKNGKFYGKWKGFDNEGKEIHLQNFKNGLIARGDNIKLSATNVPNGCVESIPVFPGCEQILGFKNQKKCLSRMIAKHVSENFNTYMAANLGLEGKQRIEVNFKIDKQGNIVEARAKAPHPLLEIEAVRIIRGLPRIKAGYQMGKPVVVPYSVPIIFAVQGKKKQ